MTTGRHLRAKEIFLAACDMPENERKAFLLGACGTDQDLKQAVESLLRSDSAPRDVLGPSPLDDPAALGEILGSTAGTASPSRVPHPATIGGYRIIRVLGAGGMGTVYEAEQQNPLRIVALKVIRPDAMTPGMLSRFEIEGHVLGRLQHSGIARIYEAGSADFGSGFQPFFAMELVRGRPLTDYAIAEHLSSPAKLRLMVEVCEAVEHAHQKGVVHRDLKPANILVDDAGHAKILDFGIARTTDVDVRSATLQTQEGQIIGTLAYMSPEQASGDPAELDSRSDVYALGTILFELLAGRPPHQLRGLPLPEAIRVIRETDAPRLGAIDRALRGDLDTIAAKALERAKERRYPSATALSADLGRFLADEPIEARPPSRIYILRKLVRRHRTLAAGASLTFLALILGLITTAHQAWEKTLALSDAKRQTALAEAREIETGRARDEARRQADRARAVNDFILLEMLAAPAPHWSGADVKVVDVLDRAAGRAELTFANEPDMLAAVDAALGGSYLELGVFDKAERHLSRAKSSCRARLGDDARDTLDVDAKLVSARAGRAPVPDMLPLARESLDRCRRLLGADNPVTLGAMHNVAFLLLGTGAREEGMPLMEEALARREEVLGPTNSNTLTTLHALCGYELQFGHVARAQELNRTALDRCEKAFAVDDPATLTVKGDRAEILLAQQKWTDVVALVRSVIGPEERAFGAEHLMTTVSMRQLAIALRHLGQLEEADVLLKRVIDIRTRKLPEGHSLVLEALNARSALLLDRGDLGAAAELLVRLVDLSRRNLPGDSIALANNVNNLACVLHRKGDLAEAEPLYREAIAIHRKRPSEAPDHFANVLHNLGTLLTGRNAFPEAVPVMREAIEIERGYMGKEHPDVALDLLAVGDALMRLGRPQEAEAPVREAVDILLKTLGAADLRLNRARNALGECLIKLERPKEAEEPLLGSYRAMIDDTPDEPLLATIRRNLVVVYTALGKPDDARAFADPPPK